MSWDHSDGDVAFDTATGLVARGRLHKGKGRDALLLEFSDSAEHAALTQSWALGDQSSGYGIACA